eukprot:NODE_27498_length_511_cov_4.835938.p2 GENE.NODE_27498_length_511_cov_4.835938~~NODE_27498_length_511_cov_4.835938.p2  ORF type:complete len:114 (+),score=34.84 NODE_27498_length_511_cov_4.835938:97-438(+)
MCVGDRYMCVSSASIMGGHYRLWHPKWFSRYSYGFFASVQIVCFCSEQQYGVTRARNPDTMWPWWSELCRKKEAGEIPRDVPGYMLAKYRTENEQRWVAQRAHEFPGYPQEEE